MQDIRYKKPSEPTPKLLWFLYGLLDISNHGDIDTVTSWRPHVIKEALERWPTYHFSEHDFVRYRTALDELVKYVGGKRAVTRGIHSVFRTPYLGRGPLTYDVMIRNRISWMFNHRMRELRFDWSLVDRLILPESAADTSKHSRVTY